MNPTLFAQILLRVLAVYLIAQAIMVVPQGASLILGSDTDWEGSNLVYWAIALAFLMPLLVGVLLWVFAPPISTAIVGGKATATTDAPLTTQSAIGAAISVAGLLIIIIYLPSLISTWVQYDAADNTFNAQKLSVHLIAQGARVGLGIVLLVGVRYWVALITRFRELGLEK